MRPLRRSQSGQASLEELDDAWRDIRGARQCPAVGVVNVFGVSLFERRAQRVVAFCPLCVLAKSTPRGVSRARRICSKLGKGPRVQSDVLAFL